MSIPRSAAIILCALVAAPIRGRCEDPAFPKVEPIAAKIDTGALERLRKRAEATGSDAVVIIKDGKLVVDWSFGKPPRPIEAMSATKSVVNLAVGRLIEAGKIDSLDQPVADFYPEWKQGRKRQITIRHLLNHTSGLEDKPMTMEIYASPDFVQFALAAEVSHDPGSRFFYSNKAVNLLAGVVEKASGVKMDKYVAKEIFEPLGITDFAWSLDRSGNPQGMAGLQIRAIDFAKVGQLMLDGGSWRGKPIVSKDWVAVSTRPAQAFEPSCGLLWWIVPETTLFAMSDPLAAELARLGFSDASKKKAEALRAKPVSREEFRESLVALLREDEATKLKADEIFTRFKTTGPGPKSVPSGEALGYAAQGYLGQFLLVIPKHRIVAVRQFRRPMLYRDDGSIDQFVDFPKLVHALVP